MPAGPKVHGAPRRQRRRPASSPKEATSEVRRGTASPAVGDAHQSRSVSLREDVRRRKSGSPKEGGHRGRSASPRGDARPGKNTSHGRDTSPGKGVGPWLSISPLRGRGTPLPAQRPTSRERRGPPPGAYREVAVEPGGPAEVLNASPPSPTTNRADSTGAGPRLFHTPGPGGGSRSSRYPVGLYGRRASGRRRGRRGRGVPRSI